MNEHGLLAAWLKIARADVGAGGLVELTGRDDPLLSWGDRKLADETKPVLAAKFVTSVKREGCPTRLLIVYRVDAVAPEGTDGVVESMLDRLEAITTQPLFFAEGVDTGTRSGIRRDGGELQPEGLRRIQDFTFDVTV